MTEGGSESLRRCDDPGSAGDGPSRLFFAERCRLKVFRRVVIDGEPLDELGAMRSERYRSHVFNRATPRAKSDWERVYCRIVVGDDTPGSRSGDEAPPSGKLGRL